MKRYRELNKIYANIGMNEKVQEIIKNLLEIYDTGQKVIEIVQEINVLI